MIKVIGIGKEFKNKVALNDIDLIFPDKGLVIIKGESGSGKTTLLNLLTALDYPTRGKIEFDGVEITPKNSENFRMKYCGNIYQDYMLIEDLSVKENIELAMQACGQTYVLEDIKTLLGKVGISEEYLDKKTAKLSGGEKQRVSIARAIAKRQAMIFADEPTGNLDSKNGKIIMDLLKDISKERLVVVVSHNEKYNELYADYTVELEDGVVKYDDLPSWEQKDKIPMTYESKSRLKPKTAVRLAFWGFEKNRVKTAISMIAFVVLSVFSLIFTVVAIGDVNLAYARSLDKCKSKNVFIYLGGDNIVQTTKDFDFEKLNHFKDNFEYGATNVYVFNLNDRDPIDFDDNETSKYYNLYAKTPYVSQAIIYNSQVGIDVEVLYGTFPKEHNDIMLPYCYAKYLSQASLNYKVDNVGELVGRDFIFARSKYYEEDKEYYAFKICGIFEEGDYYTDYEEQLDERLVNYYLETNKLASSVILSSQAQDILFNNAYLFNGGILTLGDYVKLYSLTYKGYQLCPYAYDKYSQYAKEYEPLERGEVYIEKTFAEAKGIKVGDTLENTKLKSYGFSGSKESDFDGMVVKDIFDLPDKNNFIIFSAEDYYDCIAVDKAQRGFWGYYFNTKGVKDNYKFFNDILNEGSELGIFTTGFIENIYTENISSTDSVYVVFIAFRNYAWIPAAILSYFTMAALGFVSFSYLISAKAKSYNVLRALGFGKKSLSLLLFIQIFIVIAIECLLGVIFGYISSNLLGKAIVAFANQGVPLSIASEVLLPIGYAAPMILVGVSLLLGGLIVIAKIKWLFAKSIMENKTS